MQNLNIHDAYFFFIFIFVYTKKGQVYDLFLNLSKSAVLLLQRQKKKCKHSQKKNIFKYLLSSL